MGSTPLKMSKASTVTSMNASTAFAVGASRLKTDTAKGVAECATKTADARTPEAQTAAAVPTSRRCAVILSYHSDYGELATAITEALEGCCDIAHLTQARPRLLEERERLVSWCSVFVVIASIGYQRAVALMEAVSYARVTQKRILTVVGQKRYRPFGGLGAISIADGDILDGVDWRSNDRFISLIRSLQEHFPIDVHPPPAQCPCASADETHASTSNYIVSDQVQAATNGIAISNHSETDSVRSLIESEKFDAPIVGILNESSSATASPALASCAVLVAILSPAYERSAACREHYERARALGKPVVPLIGAAGGYSPSGWVALAIAGKQFYKFSDRATAYENAKKRDYLDSVPMTDFKVAVNAQLAPLPDEGARERAEIEILQVRLGECRAKLNHWPPKNHEGAIGGQTTAELPEPPRLTMSELLADKGDGLEFNFINYKVTRMEFRPPQPLFDSRGVPVRRRLDVFISYQWDRQEFVRNVYQNMHLTFNLKAWMDVYGGMLGNTNEAMANGIECSDVFLAFLSSKYVASPNCTLEIRYAIYRKKPLIFITIEDTINFPPWIDMLVKSNLTFTLHSIEDCGKDDSGLPRLNRICDAIKRLSEMSRRPKYDEDVSEAVSDLRATLDNALLDLAEQENIARWIVCTRCGEKFYNYSRSGCKKHSAYYLGGSILAARWVCCSERSKDGRGCESADHIAESRNFTMNPDYGTYTWEPA